ncbi:YcaO-like family protein [Pendulispora albinea]|uniref:YcaO-like family protein n=1 Tax=Pendulispora albinea TaxID=2741071 RepID=A0ABZ2LZE2_9BACT
MKGFFAGTHRTVAPEVTLARVRPLMPVLGITRIANVTGLDTIGLPVVMVTRPNAKSLSVAQGKGATLAAAQASGLMEAVESHHAENITLPLKLASYKQLGFGHRLIDVAELPRYAQGSFHGDQRTLWIEGVDLQDGGPRWLPFALVHTDFTLPLPPGSGTFLMSSSGLASGNHLLEAMCHGLCELIERDAVTLWRVLPLEARRATRVDLDTVDDALCRDVLERYARAGIAVTVWDATSDIGVATFHAIIVDREPNPQRRIGPMGGMGCHPSRSIALLRALTEAAQSRLTIIAGARDDVFTQQLAPDTYLQALHRSHDEATAPGPRASFAATPSQDHERFEDDLGWILERLQSRGLTEAVAVNLTKPELGVPVVRVVVPGLEALNDLPGYCPGRRARALLDRRTPGVA